MRRYGRLPENIVLLIDYDILIDSSVLNNDFSEKLGQIVKKYTGCSIVADVIRHETLNGAYLVTKINCVGYAYQLHILASGSLEVPIVEYNLLMLLRDYIRENLADTQLYMDIEKDLEKLHIISNVQRRKKSVKGLYSRYKKLSGVKTTNNLLKYMDMDKARKYFNYMTMFFTHIV